MFAIEKHVPVPGPGRDYTRTTKYPFAKMKVGDSFFVPEKYRAAFKARMIREAAKRFRERRGMMDRKFVVRTEDGGARCWRTA